MSIPSAGEEGQVLFGIDEDDESDTKKEEAEAEGEEQRLPRSVTFHHVDDLRIIRGCRPVVCRMEPRRHSEGLRAVQSTPEARGRARSFLLEMGRFLPSLPEVAQSRSLHFFPQQATKLSSTLLESPPDVPAHHVFEPRLQYSPPPFVSRPRVITRVSVSSLDKCGKAIEEGLLAAESQLGLLCPRCAVPPLAKGEIHSSASSETLCTKMEEASVDEPLCRICHCWPEDPLDPLISPCRCAGSLQYVHVSCLMHWLDISSRKLHRPAVCELCLYKYRRRRVLKISDMKLPECSPRDFHCYSLFAFSLLLMLLSALATLVTFQLEKTLPQPKDEKEKEDTEAVMSTITLVAAVVFFIAFFLAMYAHVKSGLSFCNYVSLVWNSNLEWSVEEYRPSRDSQYMTKLEELRRKLHESEKKRGACSATAEEEQPLRPAEVLLE